MSTFIALDELDYEEAARISNACRRAGIAGCHAHVLSLGSKWMGDLYLGLRLLKAHA